ncbi:MAG: M1 family aminopeptidase, partial [Bacteroidota bacterium]
ASLAPFFVYKFYWFLFGIFMLLWALLLWTRGLPHSFGERLQLMKNRFQGRTAIGMMTFLIAFIIVGFRLYYEENVKHTFYNQKEKSALQTTMDKKYQHFANTPQPRMVGLDINLNIFPYEQRFEANGTYILVNKTQEIIDTLLVEYAEDIITTYEVDRSINLVSKDPLARFDVWTFAEGLAPNDSVALSFTIQTKDNTIFRKNNIVEQNGTYLHSLTFPSIGRWREATMPTDSAGLRNMYRSKDADFVDFKATVSTAADQIAITTGYLQKEWMEGDRRYFQYQSKEKVTNDFIVNSGKFEVVKDRWKAVDLAIYYHPDHDYNLDVMMDGMKAGLTFCSENFAPYQHDKLTIVEFTRSLGGFAQSFANTMPFSETAFLRDVADPAEEIMADLFSGVAHEVAHQWWGHQVIPANARGAIMMTEGMAEYVKAKVFRKISR